ncbi:hypothetical protein OKW42_003200 [Paraburkholderia sp. WC7.3d]
MSASCHSSMSLPRAFMAKPAASGPTIELAVKMSDTSRILRVSAALSLQASAYMPSVTYELFMPPSSTALAAASHDAGAASANPPTGNCNAIPPTPNSVSSVAVCVALIAANLIGSIEGVHFQVGNSIRQAGGHNADYAGVELKYGW